MKIIVKKVSTKNTQIFIGVVTHPKSKEYELIKKCKDVKWNNSIKLWLLPYTTGHWTEFKNIFKEYAIEIVKDETILLEQTSTQRTDSTKILEKIMPERTLNEDQYEALLKLKQFMLIKRNQPSTMKTYCSHFIEFVLYFQTKKVEDISIIDIRNYMLYKIKEHSIKERTQNSIINAIKYYYENVEKRERFILSELRPNNVQDLPDYFTEEEIALILTNPKNIKHQIILRIIYSCGLRLGEMIRLKIDDIKMDTERPFIKIKQSKGKKDRILPLSEKLIPKIKEYLHSFKPKYWFIEGQDGGKYSDRSIQSILRKAVQETGSNPEGTVHTLRHSYATHSLLQGTDVFQIQKLLGHNDIKTTKIYTHITEVMKNKYKSPYDRLDI